ncbi:CocE/NonD family hydrolase [Chloroflexota bacterium]
MFSRTWKTSERKYNVIANHDVKIPLSDGTVINADIFRPDSRGKFPAIFGFHPYDLAGQSGPIKPSANSTNFFRNPGQDKGNAYLEAGDPNFFVRRGYIHVIANVRGSGKSGGNFDFLRQQEVQDCIEVMNWVTEQSWCNGNTTLFGVSYFAMVQPFIAAKQPPHLKCLFFPWGLTDRYRDLMYRGGILSQGFLRMWALGSLDNPRVESYTRKKIGDVKFRELVAKALQDEEIQAVPELVQILRNPDMGAFPLIVDQIVNPLNGEYWEECRPDYSAIKVPCYIGSDWANYGLHLPAAFRSWENLSVPKKMIIGPPAYLDRPLYQLQYEALRWFDYWVKGIETGIMEEPPIRLFVMGTGDWKAANDWPLPETKWTPFYLHEDKLLSEHEHWVNEGYDSFDDSPWYRGYLEYTSPILVENTEVIGPIVANLYASTTDKEILWFVTLWEVDPQGNERVLTKGWLRGSHRELDPQRIKPWLPYHPHTKSEPLTPGQICEFSIPISPTGNLFKAGSRIKVKISGTDDPPQNALEAIAAGSLQRASASRITVYHDANHPSHILLPITKGNVVGTFMSGGKPYI